MSILNSNLDINSLKNKPTPSQFYRSIRPELFSNKISKSTSTLTKELFYLELDNITTNQKEQLFEVFCRKLAEKFITPNLLPQVGPTGGGDGKTDAETYPVSDYISNGFLVGQEEWCNGEKWAFAISAKKDWKNKCKNDVTSIISTNRAYTKIFFMTNQSPSSKQTQDLRDKMKIEQNIELVILGRLWITEKVFDSGAMNLAIESLNMSPSYIEIEEIGDIDKYRKKKEEDLENKISDTNRYFKDDFMLVEDCIEVAILSSRLEKSKSETLMKFDRAIRLANDQKQLLKAYYYKAWWLLYYFDDYKGFFDVYNEFKNAITEDIGVYYIEKYSNLFQSLSGINKLDEDLDFLIDIDKEFHDIEMLFLKIINNSETTSSRYSITKTYLIILRIMNSIRKGDLEEISSFLDEIKHIFQSSINHIDYPYELFVEMIQIIGEKIPNHLHYDNLIDIISDITAKRSSEISSAKIYLERAMQKLKSKYYYEAIISLGKSIDSLAKEESLEDMYDAISMLSFAYHKIGLLWAANSCHLLLIGRLVEDLGERREINENLPRNFISLALNELLLGRFLNFIEYRDLALGIAFRLSEENGKNLIEATDCFFAKILVKCNVHTWMDRLPCLLKDRLFKYSHLILMYRLGYEDVLIKEGLKKDNILEVVNHFLNSPSEIEFDRYCDALAYSDKNILYSYILGSLIEINIENIDKNRFLGMTLLTYMETFLATTKIYIIPRCDKLKIGFSSEKNIGTVECVENGFFLLGTAGMSNFIEGVKLNEYISKIFGYIFANGFVFASKKELDSILSTASIGERINIVFSSNNIEKHILKDKFFLSINKLLEDKQEFPLKKSNFAVASQEEQTSKAEIRSAFDSISHQEIHNISIINEELWNKAKWRSFGFESYEKALYIYLGFEDIVAGEKIFDELISKFGNEDNSDKIRISIVKDIKENDPSAYTVIFGQNIDASIPAKMISMTSRIRELENCNPENLKRLEKEYQRLNSYFLIPAKIDYLNKKIIFIKSKFIKKQKLIFKKASEVDRNDVDYVAIALRDKI